MDGFQSPAAAESQNILPVIVDLDDTLLRTDTLYESFAAGIFKQPVGMLTAVAKLSQGRAHMKRAISAHADVDWDVLPANSDLIAYLEAQKEAGRELHLVSAADQGIVDRVAERFGFFRSAVGSDGTRNLKGQNKAAYLQQTFPDGFVYAGDSAADLAVWEKAQGAILVGVSEQVATAAANQTRVEARFDGHAPSLKDWRKCFRLHQWAKNVLLFVALFLGHAYGDLGAWAEVIAGFFLFSIAASGTYVLNDLADLSSDRRHDTKRDRPLAAGRVPIRLAMPLAFGSIGFGLIGMLILGPLSFFSMICYLIITLSYSFRLKRIPMLDVVILASLYTLRIVLGASLAGVVVSEWLLVFSMFFFLSLSMAKRYVEVAKKADQTSISGRGYAGSDAMLLLNFGVATASCALFTVCIYLLESAFPSGAYSTPQFLWIAALAIALWVMRVWLLAFRGQLDDDPVAFAVKDRQSIGLGALATIGVLLSIVV
ncbi:MAG: UbiA family prenyltransferase [Pseudomonadota bacterium]